MNPRTITFDDDPDSDGFRIDIWGEPDARGFVDCLGHIDLFAHTLYLENRRSAEYMPKFADRAACITWVTARLHKLSTKG